MTRTGLDVLAESGFDRLKGRRVGLLANHTAVDRSLRHAVDLMHEALGDGLVRLFAPEHGLRGEAQDMVSVETMSDRRTGLPIVSLYASSEDSLSPSASHTDDLDVVVFDVQDVGARYYTFQATLALTMEAAKLRRFDVVVLDRPNPIGGYLVEGNVVEEGFESFVGCQPLAVRHGMTVAELSRYFAAHCGLDASLEVVPMDGWKRSHSWRETGLTWVMPSPNMPTIETAQVYPGMCLIEGTNLSEGRGTTRPFELVGAPWLDGPALREALESESLPGVRFREASFRPTFHKHAGLVCEGVQLHVTDFESFLPVRTGVAVVRAARALTPDRFEWRAEVYEFVSDRLAFDLLAGTDRTREMIERGAELAEIESSWSAELTAFEERRRSVLLYE